MAAKTFEDVIKNLPRFKLVSRPAETVEEARDPTTIYGTRTIAEIAREVASRTRPETPPKK